jgi:hypothetical protein
MLREPFWRVTSLGHAMFMAGRTSKAVFADHADRNVERIARFATKPRKKAHCIECGMLYLDTSKSQGCIQTGSVRRVGIGP